MTESSHATCPDCGSPLSAEAWAEGLCLRCLAALAERDPAGRDPLADAGGRERRPSAGAVAETSLAAGEVLGDRYRIRSHLGSGGMGEVWLAFDLKLRVDVALKSLRPELLADPGALETLRREVPNAREVISPNVCRVFDLHEVDGQEWISMEHVDGTSLAEILADRGPLDLDEAGELAAQFLAGLEAIHEAGLLHRDVKPENLMVTRTGRVVVMDFGVAKILEAGKSRRITGTPAYMSPEHARGEVLDARADVFSAGVVLAEMVAPARPGSSEDRRRVWQGIRAERPEVADTPWAGVIARAVAADRDNRLGSVAALARALEEVTFSRRRSHGASGAGGDEDARPYPGLAAFTADDARFFFGRGPEVEALLKKLRRPHLMGLIGVPGAGKSSLLAAGLVPALPAGWRAVVATPGPQPFAALARAFLPELAVEGETVVELPDSVPFASLRGDDPEEATAQIARWRRRHGHAILILDHFEELFTQNPPDLQQSFAELVAALPLAADVHVLISVRDDFLMACHGLEALRPVFSDLTPLGPPRGSALRRAIVQPALRCGYRFEDDELVEEMLAAVEGERGALPLLAFAVARLWEKRDREQGLLTRRAYAEIGGVDGSLARHAEATLERIGRERVPVVRELFRNLVTAQGTRATRDRQELLSVFQGAAGDAAGGVLDALIDARLLSSYEEPGPGGESLTRIEMVHESLLTGWPRLVRWWAQDAEGALLRDDLRYSARRWRQRGQPDYLLWEGGSRGELELWREGYAGGLSRGEQEFVDAVTRRARRRRRRRWLSVGAAIVVLAVLAAVAILWR